MRVIIPGRLSEMTGEYMPDEAPCSCARCEAAITGDSWEWIKLKTIGGKTERVYSGRICSDCVDAINS